MQYIDDPFVWPGYDQQAWVEVQRYRERPWAELVDLWVGLSRHISAIIESVPVEKLQTPCTIGEREPTNGGCGTTFATCNITWPRSLVIDPGNAELFA